MKTKREDYLRIIFELEEKRGVKNVELARKLKISKASVSEMLRKLASSKLVTVKPYSRILLTRKGRQEAELAFDNYCLTKEFIKKFLGLNEEKQRKRLTSWSMPSHKNPFQY